MAKSSKTNLKNAVHWGSLLFGVILGVILTSSIFYFFSTSSITLEIPVKPVATAEVPSVPEPHFDFYTELTKTSPENSTPTKQTFVENKIQSLKSNNKSLNKQIKGFVVLVGAFKNNHEADALRARLTLHGFAAKIDANKVLLGPFKNEKDALATKAQLKTECNLDSILKEIRG